MPKFITVEDIKIIQKSLGDLGFNLTSDNTFYKEYVVNNKKVKLIPNFVTYSGTVGKSYRLASVKIGKVVVPIEQGTTKFNKLPPECISDVMAIIANLAADIALAPKEDIYIYTAMCDKCGTMSNSFFKMGQHTLCITCL